MASQKPTSVLEGLSSDRPVLVIGAAGIDIVGKVSEDLSPETSCPAIIRTSFGGVARNVGENLARLGQSVILLTVIGEDQGGEQLIGQAISSGIDVHAVMRTSEHPTGCYLAVVNSEGERMFALDDMRAIGALSPEYIRKHAGLFKEASLVFMDANLSREVMKTIVTLAQKAHIPIYADPTSTSLANRLCDFLPNLALISPNSAEAGVLWGQSFYPSNRKQALEAAKYLVGKGVDIAIVTLGKFGLCYATSETSGHIPAINTRILDPTGAGDALSAAVIFALMNGMPIDDAVRLGVSAASLTLNYPGAVIADMSLEKLYDHLVI